VRAALDKRHARSRDEVGHRAGDEHLAGAGNTADAVRAVENETGDAPFSRDIAFTGVEPEVRSIDRDTEPFPAPVPPANLCGPVAS
jgi:hypothetical protein